MACCSAGYTMKHAETRKGVDEAGRGPLLGPMVIATVHIPSEDTWLNSSPVTDSKDLTTAEREDLVEEIINRYNYRAVIISPHEIDEAVTKPGDSLTELEIRYIKQLIGRETADQIIIDAPTKKNPFNADNIVYEHEADAKYKCVGAASILAKTIRDHAVQRISREIGEEIGSGYPSDPATQAYIERADLDKHFIRTSWKPIQKIKTQREQTSLPTT